MQKEKLAVIALVIIVVCAISALLVLEYGQDILKNKSTIELGDCVDVNYIGRYASNTTIFDSSYNDTINKTGGTPANFFITLNQSESPPEGYETYMYDIEGFIEGLIGLKEGDTKTIGPIPPDKAYGAKKLKIGDKFSTKVITGDILNQTVEVVNLTDENMVLKWFNVEEYMNNFTMPAGVFVEYFDPYAPYESLPPYYIWENSSKIIDTTNETAVIITTPTKTENLTEQTTLIGVGDKMGFIFPDATTAEWNDTKIIIKSSPLIGTNYTLDYQDYIFNLSIINVTEDHINVSIESEGQITPWLFNRSIEFNRTCFMRRIYIIPLMYSQYIFAEDLERAGYSLSELAGEELLFEVTIEKIYKTSQEES